MERLRICMNEFGQKGSMTDKDFMIYILKFLPKQYDVILNGIDNHLMVTGDDALAINMICGKLNHRYKKIENRKEEKVEKKKLWACTISSIVCFSNSNYAGDPVSRQSISGFILYVLGVPVSWQSKLQKRVSLSSSEAEYITLSEAVKEVMFVVQHLGSMKMVVKYPVMVRVDNIGTIFMASKITTTCHTKQIDIRYKYVNEYVEDGVVNIFFVKSAENDINILTKSLNAELCEKHSKKMVIEKP